MKHVSSKQFFIEKCAIIIKQKRTNKDFFKQWSEYYSKDYYRYYISYKKEAEARGLEFEISETEWNNFSKMECYLCNYKCEKGLSVDRIDNTIRKYSVDNCRTCCSSCNIMKGEMSLTDLIEQCKRILAKHTLPEIDAKVDIKAEPKLNIKIEPVAIETEIADRKHWKAVGLYTAILCNSADNFLEHFSSVYTKAEFVTLCKQIKETEKTKAIERLQKLIRALKQRRIRLKE